MVRIAQLAAVAVFAVLACVAGGALADDVTFSNLGDRLTRLEREMESRRPAPRHAVRTASFLSDEAPAAGEPRPMVAVTCAAACCDSCESYEDPTYGESCCAECECGGSGNSAACCESSNSGGLFGQFRESDFYAQVQFHWLRAHVHQAAIGKLSEQYELSPRIVLGYEGKNGHGGRIRYWHYGHQTPLLGSGDGIRFVCDVYDIETTRRFKWSKTELVIAGGMRWADLEVLYNDRLVHLDAPGLTLAADLRNVYCANCSSEFATICGGRLSVLGGDWEGSNSGFIGRSRDDNLVVHELYGGVEYVHHSRRFDTFARLTIEVQNWHSDAAAQTAGADSIGFFGPGVHFGISR